MHDLDPSLTELNLGFLLLLRERLLRDRLGALAEFEVDSETADRLLQLTQGELRHLAAAQVLLVGLRWRRPSVWRCLADFARGRTHGLAQALVVAEGEGGHGYPA